MNSTDSIRDTSRDRWLRALGAFGAALFLMSWPAVTYGPNGDVGFTACIRAFLDGHGLQKVSPFTNLLFIAWLFAVLRPRYRLLRIAGALSVFSFLFNLLWLYYRTDEHIGPLRVGYYVWLVSFLVIGVVLLIRSDDLKPGASGSTPSGLA